MKAIFYPDVAFNSLYLPWIHKEIYFDGIYKHFTSARDMTMLDIGANIGEVTRFFQSRCKKIYAVEPSALEFECLCKNAEFNGWDNVELFNMAISGTDGEASFQTFNQNRTMNRLSPNGSVKVPTRRLDTFLSLNQIGHVDFLKMDVEGAEQDILTGDGFAKVANKIDAVLVEFHEPNPPRVTSAKMVSLGYHVDICPTAAVVYLYTRQ